MDDLKERTKRFALRVIRLVQSLPKHPVASTLGGQLLRCGTSVAANYRAACRGRSAAEFEAKMGIVEEEADESIFWIEMLVESGYLKAALVADLKQEADELTAIAVSSIKTSRLNNQTRSRKR
jgi:four helix bundle protein